MSETRVKVCDCGCVYDPSAAEANRHDMMPCPLCHLKWDHSQKINNEQSKRFDLLKMIDNRNDRINELEEQIKDLQEQINDINEELE